MNSAAQSTSDDGVVEEVTVEGRRSAMQMRAALIDAQEDIYAMLNEQIAEPELEITCEREVPLRSRIATRVCRPRFARDVMTRFSRTQVRGITDDPEAVLLAKNRLLNEKIVQAVNANPVLYEAVLEFERLRNAYFERLGRPDEALPSGRIDVLLQPIGTE